MIDVPRTGETSADEGRLCRVSFNTSLLLAYLLRLSNRPAAPYLYTNYGETEGTNYCAASKEYSSLGRSNNSNYVGY